MRSGNATHGLQLRACAAREPRPELDRYRRDGLLIEIIAERAGAPPPAAPDADAHADAALAGDVLEAAIRAQVRALVASRLRGVAPFIDVRLLPAPDAL